jgi:hypothetical protein
MDGAVGVALGDVGGGATMAVCARAEATGAEAAGSCTPHTHAAAVRRTTTARRLKLIDAASSPEFELRASPRCWKYDEGSAMAPAATPAPAPLVEELEAGLRAASGGNREENAL